VGTHLLEGGFVLLDLGNPLTSHRFANARSAVDLR
jgi:hypothetical protein